MARRGPDHAAARSWSPVPGRNVTLLHTRLAIVDLHMRANQPLQVGTKWMVSNSELYNYRELRANLLAAGRSFATSSDTEVLLHAIDAWGWSALDRCEGMWAFAVYDEEDGSLVLARDRFGEKPLWLFHDGDDLYFGSEVKFIAALAGRRLRANLRHVRRYLLHGYRALYKSTESFHEGIEALAPATLLRLDVMAPEKRQTYWAPRFDPDDGMSYDDAVQGTRQRLRRSIELRLRADVPAAFCLSGGLDSNALVAIAKRDLAYDVEAFTAVLDDPRYDERPQVDAVVAALGVRHRYVRPERTRFLERLRELVRQHDGPLATISYYVHWSVMEAQAAHGYRISVSGTGADELFAGYYDHHLAYLHEMRGDPPVRVAAEAAWRQRVLPHVRNPLLRDPSLFDREPHYRAHLFGENGRFRHLLQDGTGESFAERGWTNDLLRNRMLNELTTEVVPAILYEDDLNAMYFSVENRAPFLDRELVDFAFRIPTRLLIRDGFGKAVLRDAVRGVVPDVVVDQPRKVGFNAPVEELLHLRDAATRAEILREGPIFDIVRPDQLETLLAQAAFDNSESKFLFNVLNAKLFLEEAGA